MVSDGALGSVLRSRSREEQTPVCRENALSKRATDASDSAPLPAVVSRTDDLVVMLSRVVKLLESNAVVDQQQRQRIAVDSFIATIPALTTVTTVTTVTQIHAVDSRSDQGHEHPRQRQVGPQRCRVRCGEGWHSMTSGRHLDCRPLRGQGMRVCSQRRGTLGPHTKPSITGACP